MMIIIIISIVVVVVINHTMTDTTSRFMIGDSGKTTYYLVQAEGN